MRQRDEEAVDPSGAQKKPEGTFVSDSDETLQAFLEDELFKGKLAGPELCIATKLRAVLMWMQEQALPRNSRKGWQNLCKAFHDTTRITIQKKQLRTYVSVRHEMARNYCDGRKRRERGGGRKCSVSAVEKRCAQEFREAAENGRPMTRNQGMDALGTASEGVYSRFLGRYGLREKNTEIDTRISVERIAAQLQDFHRHAQRLFNMFPSLSADHVVQFDEIALSMSGSLTSTRRRIGIVGQSLVSETCAMFDHKKCATGLFFLSGVKMPPLVFFPASDGFVDKCATHSALRYTRKGNMTEDAFVAHVLPHIKEHNPRCRVVVFDSATSHVTPKCRKAVNDNGLWDLIIPANCTAMVQALDVFYFSVYRKTHAAIVASVVEQNGIDMYKKMSRTDRRKILAEICTKSAEVINVDVASIFCSLGYINPSQGVKLPHLPTYEFHPDVLDEDWMAKLSPVRVDPVVSTNAALISEAVEILANAQVNGTQSREKRPRQVEVACTCGHGTTRGRHKRGCAKTAPALQSEDGVRQPTMLEKLLSQRSVSDIHNQPHAPEKLEKMLARGTMSQRVDHHIADDEEVERILFPDNEEVVFVAKEEPLWGCFHPRQMISTRTINCSTLSSAKRHLSRRFTAGPSGI